MKEVDLSPMKEVDTSYSKLVDTLERSFKCDWDDAVHDTYSVYIKQMKELAEKSKKCRSRTELIEKEADDLNLDVLLKEADYLCREADAV